MPEYVAIIGLEVHAQLNTRSKLFCACPVDESAEPNANICPICMGHPGTLPSLNAAAVALAIRAALATGCTVHAHSTFARKHYFYPDLPKGFQITQDQHPIATAGTLHTAGKRFAIRRIHIEEDSGKSFHSEDGSLLDWNRAGVPLIEIVTEADAYTAEQAEAYLRMLHRVLVEAGICRGDLERGHFRCDVNVSVHQEGRGWGTRVEIKNINSFRFVAKAIRFELDRQIVLLQAGAAVEQETRTWAGNKTLSLRKKESGADYRYLPEPDLGPLLLDEGEIAAQRTRLPGVPLDLHLAAIDEAKMREWVEQYGLSADSGRALQSVDGAASLFEAAVAAGGDAQAMLNWMNSEVLRRGKIGQLTGNHLRDIQAMVDAGSIQRDGAKQIFATLWETGGDAATLLSRHNVSALTDTATLQRAVDEVLSTHPKQLAQYREGNRGLLGFFMGKAMAHTQRRADPTVLQRLLMAALETSAG